jgi:hypothetical protein
MRTGDLSKLSCPGEISRHYGTLLATSIALSAMVVVWTYGLRHFFIPCIQDCGETFDALQSVANYRLYGFRYGMVQDYAIAPNLVAHPFFYTHNVNFASIIFTVVDAIGLAPFWSKQLVTIVGFGAGLLYVYRATAYFTGSVTVTLVAMLFFVTDIRHVLAFGLNPLRARHWLVLFGVLFHVARFVSQSRFARVDRLAIFFLAMLAFGIGYDFWIIAEPYR